MMRVLLILFSTILMLSGCASMRASQNVLSGRQAFLIGDHEVAQAYFRRAAEIDPNYIYYTQLPQGIWSYVGRAEYASGRYPQARQSLERALSLNRDENLARLYLGLTLAREGDRQRGLKELETGMRGLYEWIEYVTQAHRFSYGQYWDIRREIRSEIQSDLAMISGKDVNWERLIASSERVGKLTEEEIDRARYHESLDRSRDLDSKSTTP
jgi:tetratricopeptide (TPR) repeat protein